MSTQTSSTSSGPQRVKRAQGILEFALILPIALMLIFGVIEFARLFQAWLVVTNSARMGVRYAVTGEYNPVYCNAANDSDGDGLYCEDEDEKTQKQVEIDGARLESIYDVTTAALVGISRSDSEPMGSPGYYKITVCSSNENFLYHPPPSDECTPNDNPGDPSAGPVRVLVAVTFEHPIILPFLSSITPSVQLHAERTGIVEQFRVARVLGLPPDINLPTATPLPTSTATVTDTPTSTPEPNCDAYSLGAASFPNHGFVEMNVVNGDVLDTYVTGVEFEWEYVEFLHSDTRLDWFAWDTDSSWEDGTIMWGGNTNGSPYDNSPNTSTASDLASTFPGNFSSPGPLFEAGENYIFRADFDNQAGDFESTMQSDYFGVTIYFANGCILNRPASPPPTPAPNCDLYSLSDFSFPTNWGAVDIDVTNGDIYGTYVDVIDFDWGHAESYDELIDPDDELAIDWFQWNGSVFWGDGDGEPRDYNANTNTASDHAGTFSGPSLGAGDTRTLRIDFDNEADSFETYHISDDFGITIDFANGCTLNLDANPQPLPTPDCDEYSIGDFSWLDQYNRIAIDVVNNDIFPANVTSIDVDWDYVDAFSDGMGSSAHTDYIRWSGNGTNVWDGEDYDSHTVASSSSPGWQQPDSLSSGDDDTISIDFDWDNGDEEEWMLRDLWSVQLADFGIVVEFDTGCVLTVEAQGRVPATPTPDCSNLYAYDVGMDGGDEFNFDVQNDNLDDADFIDSSYTWPDGAGASQYPCVDTLRFDYSHYWDVYGGYCEKSATLNKTPSLPYPVLAAGASARWDADTDNSPVDIAPYGHYRTVLTFEYASGLVCTVVAELDVLEPSATAIPTNTLIPSDTPTPTNTATRTTKPTDTPTFTITPSRTPKPTDTPSSTPTPSNTPEDTPTSTATSDETSTPTLTETNTPWPTQDPGG